MKPRRPHKIRPIELEMFAVLRIGRLEMTFSQHRLSMRQSKSQSHAALSVVAARGRRGLSKRFAIGVQLWRTHRRGA